MSYGGRPLNSVRQNKNIIPLLRDVAQVNKKRREAYNLEKQKKTWCNMYLGRGFVLQHDNDLNHTFETE